MIELTQEQIRALSTEGAEPARVLNPTTKQSYVLVSADVYERLRNLLAATELDPEALYQRIAELDPEDWEDPAVYGISVKQ
jgi:hypothetical protein